MKFEIPVGIITTQPPEWKLESDIGQLNLSDKYIYQHGKHYISALSDSAGGYSAHIKRLAPGIETIAVFTIQGSKAAFQGILGRGAMFNWWVMPNQTAPADAPKARAAERQRWRART